jgi:uncharacterized membrane protein (DUF2068 family)
LQSSDQMDTPNQLSTRDAWILRIIAVYHLLKAGFFFALSFGLKHYVRGDMYQFLQDYLIEPFHFDPSSKFLKVLLEKASDLTPHTLRFFSYVFFAYSIIFAVEGIGLYLRKRWAEYMVVIVVTSLLPFEIYEIYVKLAWWKVGLVIGNLLVVAFLIKILIDGAQHHKKKL